ncbi:MAG: ABC transporter ATP-binding protein/permease [Mollicutes bacterium]|nr:ABC transporter ATP-binding protein/permease [Mollicutes bacterium]MDY4215589.1 ABC transporter ATP-binding protein [Candidatus Onthovivens sp.]
MEKALHSTKKYIPYFIIGPLFKVIEVIFELLTPFLMKYIVDEGFNAGTLNNDYTKIIYPGLIMIAFAVFGFCSTLVCQKLASIASQGTGTELRNKIYRKIINFSNSDIEHFGKGNLVNLLTNDVNRIQSVVAMIIRLVIRAPILVIGSVVCAFLIDIYAGIIFVSIVPLVMFIYFLILKISGKQYKKVQKQNDKIVEKTNDDISGIKAIKSFNNEEKEINEYEQLTSSYYFESKKAILTNELINPLTIFIVNVAIMAVIYLATYTFKSPFIVDLRKGDVVALISYLNSILLALIALCNLILVFVKGFSSNARINEFLNYKEVIDNKGKCIKDSLELKENLVKFNDVSLSFNNENNVLNHIDFEINKGETIGLIGGTGSGKTLLINVLERFYDFNEGEIFYKGINIKDYDISSLRNDIGLVSQKPHFLKGTIKSNMLIGKSDASDEEIIEALKMSKAYEFVSKYDDLLNHEVLENGKNFSGGQKQRLAIARGILRAKDLLILDDSTSALDYLTDKEVRKNLKRKKITTLIISQRCSSIKDADRIYIIEHGEIVGVGTHKQLLKNNEVYKEIYASQTRSK